MPALRFVALGAATLASAWWLECELIDDAHHFGWSVAQGTYFALQGAVVASVWWKARYASPAGMRLPIGGPGPDAGLHACLHGVVFALAGAALR